MLSNYRSETFCVGFVTVFCHTFFCSEFLNVRCTRIISKFIKLNFFLKIFTFFHLFLWKSPIPGLPGVFMAYYCRFAIKIVPKMPHWEISIWLAKNNGKYHAWLWSSRVKIMDLSQVAEFSLPNPSQCLPSVYHSLHFT